MHPFTHSFELKDKIYPTQFNELIDDQKVKLEQLGINEGCSLDDTVLQLQKEKKLIVTASYIRRYSLTEKYFRTDNIIEMLELEKFAPSTDCEQIEIFADSDIDISLFKAYSINEREVSLFKLHIELVDTRWNIFNLQWGTVNKNIYFSGYHLYL